MNITVKIISVENLIELQKIAKLTFKETFSEGNTEENMNEYLENKFSLEKIKEEFYNENSEFYFAEYDNSIIGYLKINTGKSQTEIKDENSLEIERIYVLKEFHGKKIGQILFDKAIELAKIRNLDYVWLGVWEENMRAIEFYKKNGFIAFDKHIFRLGKDEQTDIMMKLKINR